MAKPATRELVHLAEQAGYRIDAVEQLRPNRWLLIVVQDDGERLGLLVQARPLISAIDVQDLAELVGLRRLDGGILLAYGGTFSPGAQRTLVELSDSRLRLCTTLPPAPKKEPSAAAQVHATLKSIP
jgi:hypothetical protein